LFEPAETGKAKRRKENARAITMMLCIDADRPWRANTMARRKEGRIAQDDGKEVL